jgi:hypothetical protein
MRRVMLMLAAMAVMVSLFAAAAYAADTYGTSAGETLFESERNDKILGRQGGDDIYANLFGPNGELDETSADRDVAEGNRGADYISVRDGDGLDTATGGEGRDVCWGDPNDELDCEVENGETNPIN